MPTEERKRKMQKTERKARAGVEDNSNKRDHQERLLHPWSDAVKKSRAPWNKPHRLVKYHWKNPHILAGGGSTMSLKSSKDASKFIVFIKHVSNTISLKEALDSRFLYFE